MFIGSMSLFITITAHIICTVIRLFQAFVLYEDGTQPLYFYADLRQTTEVVKTGFLVTSLIAGDVMVIYRVWIVWSHKKAFIIFPLCTLIGLIICGSGITYQFSQYVPGEVVFESVAGRWITSNCVFTLCTNVYCSAVIAWKVWSNHNAISRHGGSNLMGVLAMFIESAILYTTWTLIFFITYQTKTNVQFPIVDTWPAVSGISFMLINVRVGLGKSIGTSQIDSRNASGTGSAAPGILGNRSYPLRPLTVEISQSTRRDNDLDVPVKGMFPTSGDLSDGTQAWDV
ncbi:uncharacterized protein C8Q71DRAFT_794946 [Rhodofomes roseus]|uniref:Uncharacterized protein n=1 Tax=Rhodofomes roseus TaxID=34475 RepID=A0ABQ8KQR0_9APHY|nr:uncharacterized protein C8Q71DRAFT_794946 [Rhodofomes roseus]KAH9840964.1 hypothetical protein C8Q71DRAFT_794946 [Rhodofomes roseus]